MISMCFVYSTALSKSVEVACIGMFKSSCANYFVVGSLHLLSPLFFFGRSSYLVHLFAEHVRRCSDAICSAKACMSDVMIGPEKEQTHQKPFGRIEANAFLLF